MSMISSLIDELNKSADEWNSSNMFELARMCREAADTIWELRDDLQRANDSVRDAEHDESRAWDRVRKVEAENAKLHNLVQKFSKFEKNGCHECPMEEDCKVLCVYDGDCGMAVEIDEEMRELGIEVD